ncbi:MAG: MBL fold metallo-hydrolase [Deltaproteobacteria bacterium]|nr:MAG: MBL fold metallo-hydrolase [Deltaproteobacteria bacterium]
MQHCSFVSPFFSSIFFMALGAILTLVVSLWSGCGEPPGNTQDGGVANSCSPASYPAVDLHETPPVKLADCTNATPLAQLAETQLKAAAETRAKRRQELLDKGKITVVACGTGNPVPSDRAQSCLAIFAGGQFFVFDTGDRAARSLETLGLPTQDLTAVFITHFHSDHIADLGEVVSRSWIMGRTNGVLPIYGPKGLQRIVDGFNLVYSLDESYRFAHHGPKVFTEGTNGMKAFPFESPSEQGSVVFEKDGVTIKAFPVDHSPVAPSVGYRLEYGGRVIAVSGDSIVSPGFKALSKDADLLVSEVLSRSATSDFECAFRGAGDERNAKIFADVRTYHISIEELAKLANDAGVKALMLVHMTPSFGQQTQVQNLFGNPIVQAGYKGKLILAVDGTEEVFTTQ